MLVDILSYLSGDTVFSVISSGSRAGEVLVNATLDREVTSTYSISIRVQSALLYSLLVIANSLYTDRHLEWLMPPVLPPSVKPALSPW